MKTLRRRIPAVIISISMTALLVLFFVITQKLNILREAPGDNGTWGLSQIQVDLLRLSEAVNEAEITPEAELTQVRRRFDNAYSRVSSIRHGKVYAEMLQDAGFSGLLETMQKRLEALVPLIDGTPAALRADLPRMADTLEALDADARDLAFAGIALQSLTSDAERSNFAGLLSLAAAITVALIIFLVGMSVLQLRSYRAFRRISKDADRAKTRLNASFEVSLDAIVVADDQGIILEFNEAAEKVFGYARQEVVGNQMAELIIPPHLRDKHHAGMARFNRTKEPRLVGQGRVEIVAMRKSGDEFPVEITIGQAQDHRGTIFISYLRDITKRQEAELNLKQARDDALQAERAKSNFLAVMSHEMRTPLNGIFGTIELLKKTELDTTQEDYLDIAKRSGDILLHHVNDVLDITRIDAGQLELSHDVFDLRGFFEDVIKTNEPAAVSSGTMLNLDISGVSDVWVRGDEQRLRQIAYNLISNALKFTDHGSVSLQARTNRTGSTVTLDFEVTDTGAGISDEDQTKVFDKFFTQQKSYDRMASGAGLGLAICKQITDKMGGVISLKSALGQGSTFGVSIPLAVAESPVHDGKTTAIEPTAPQLTGQHILLVEDNEINRMIVRTMLEREGAEVSEAHNGVQAVEAAKGDAFDAILMDISMPKMNGVDATLHIRSGDTPNSATPILALTAHALREEQERFLEAGMHGCLNKPISQAALAQGLVTVLGKGDVSPAQHTADLHIPVVDPAIFDTLQDLLKSEKTQQLAEKFDVEIGHLLDALPGHLNADGLPALSEICHRSIGSAGMIGLLSFQADLRGLEQAARAGDVDQAEAAAQTIKDAWPTSKAALMARL